MKIGQIVFTLFASMMLLATLRGQDAAPPSVDLGSRQTDEPTTSPRPSASPNLPDVSQLDEYFKESSLGKAADDRKLHVEWRRLANQAASDPEVIEAKAVVEKAHTDIEKRQRLRTYYDVYYGRMRAMAATAEMKTALDSFKTEHLSHINQPRVRHETDGALPTPTPNRKEHKENKKK
ncbi:MAG: hypothetical protein ABI925_03210 [Verrucomicrobiota bacterium]